MIFLNKNYSIRTFKPFLENFAIILKGKSVENIDKVYQEYEDCFLVNNFDKEIEKIGQYLENKNIVHFVNRLMTAPLKAENYQHFNINEIQLCKTSALFDRPLLKAIWHYKHLGLSIVYLPKEIILISKKLFGSNYAKKFPNTGLVAILYALEILRPKNLWIIGLDFYTSDYLVRRPHQAPIEQQQAKMERIKAADVFQKWISEYEETKFNVVTYYDKFEPRKNLNIIKN